MTIQSDNGRNSDGTFASGNDYSNGRTGPNKITRERKEKLMQVIQAIENDHLDDDLKALKPDERIHIWLQCHEYLVPKLARTEASIEIPDSLEQLLSLSQEERRQRIVQLRELLAQKGMKNGYNISDQ